MKLSDFSKLIKLRLTFLVVFSASISFLIGSKVNGHIDWVNWGKLIIGGFLVTAAAKLFLTKIIEKDLDLFNEAYRRQAYPGRSNDNRTGSGVGFRYGY